MKGRSRLIGVFTLLLAGASLATIAAERGPSTKTEAAAGPQHIDAAPAAGPAGPPITFTDGALSIDALIAEFLDAVEHKDEAALHRLRVTKQEYQQIIVPGTAEKGQLPRQISEMPREFFWSLTDRKSRYAAENILQNFGGLHFTSHDVRFTKGVNEYLWYTAYGQVRIDLRRPENPDVMHLKTGTIAKVDDRYKFLAFNWNN